MKPKSTAPSGSGNAATPEGQPTYRNNQEVDARIDAYIKENPRYWSYVQGMPRERLERTVVLGEIKEIDRRERMQEGVLKRIGGNPELKKAYELIVKDLPEDQREAVIAQLARQAQRTVARKQGVNQSVSV